MDKLNIPSDVPGYYDVEAHEPIVFECYGGWFSYIVLPQ